MISQNNNLIGLSDVLHQVITVNFASEAIWLCQSITSSSVHSCISMVAFLLFVWCNPQCLARVSSLTFLLAILMDQLTGKCLLVYLFSFLYLKFPQDTPIELQPHWNFIFFTGWNNRNKMRTQTSGRQCDGFPSLSPFPPIAPHAKPSLERRELSLTAFLVMWRAEKRERTDVLSLDKWV